MKKTLVFLFLFFFLLNLIHAIQEKKGPMDYNGYWWKELELGEKLRFVEGYVSCAMQIVNEIFMVRIGAYGKLTKKDFSLLNKRLIILKERLKMMEMEYNLSKVTFGQLIDGIDEVYSNYANVRIPVTSFIKDVAKVAKGEMTKDELEEWLEECRKIVSKK